MKTHPEEDQQVGRNIGGLENVSYLHLCLIYRFMKKTSTHMLDMIQNIQFKANHNPNNLQRKLRNDVKEIRKDKHVFVKADKTTNYYKTTLDEYLRLLNKNVTKAYKKTDLNVPYMIATKDKLIAEQRGRDDWIDVSAHRDSYITMKDYNWILSTTWPVDSSIQARLKLALSVNTC